MRLRHVLAATTAAAAIIAGAAVDGGTAGVASAAGTGGAQSPAAVQAVGDAAINLRLADLRLSLTEVAADGVLGPDAAVLQSRMQADVSGLGALEATIDAATTRAQARAEVRQIYIGYRVLALVLPVFHMVRADDEMTDVVVVRLQGFAAHAASRVTPADAATIDPLLADLNRQVGTASVDLAGVASTLLALTPGDWNANHQVLQPASASLKEARIALLQARADAATVLADLEAADSGRGGPAATTSTTVGP